MDVVKQSCYRVIMSSDEINFILYAVDRVLSSHGGLLPETQTGLENIKIDLKEEL